MREALTQTPISAVLELVVQNDLRPRQIAAVHVRTLARAADILADPSKYDPRTREAAGHSLPYCVAAAIVHRRVTPAQFTPAALGDPAVRALLPRVKVSADPEADRLFPAVQRATVRIETVDGRAFSRTLDHPKGDARDPLDEGGLESKFASLAEGVLGDARRRRLLALVRALEDVPAASALMREVVADVPRP